MGIYTRTYLKGRINAGIKGKIGMLIDSSETSNQAARTVFSDVDLRSAKRITTLSPNLFSEIYTYPAPSDMKGQGIIDIRPQVNRSTQSEFNLTTSEQFDRLKDNRSCAVRDEDGLRKILISAAINDDEKVISTLDSLTSGGGTWTVTGAAANLVANSDNYVKGSASLKYDIDASVATTAGYRNIALNSFDITEYLTNQIFHYVYISNVTGLTSYTLRIGSSVSNYYTQTVTTTHEGTAFSVGWNLLRFDMSTATTSGTPTSTACTYVEIFMTKLTSKVSQTGFRADHIWAKKGEVYQLSYYTKYPWQNTSGTYIANSTSDADFLVADDDEVEMIVQKGIELAAAEVDELTRETTAASKYTSLKNDYLNSNPSEAKLIITQYYQF